MTLGISSYCRSAALVFYPLASGRAVDSYIFFLAMNASQDFTNNKMGLYSFLSFFLTAGTYKNLNVAKVYRLIH
jgi:hypothetical protein